MVLLLDLVVVWCPVIPEFRWLWGCGFGFPLWVLTAG